MEETLIAGSKTIPIFAALLFWEVTFLVPIRIVRQDWWGLVDTALIIVCILAALIYAGRWSLEKANTGIKPKS